LHAGHGCHLRGIGGIYAAVHPQLVAAGSGCIVLSGNFVVDGPLWYHRPLQHRSDGLSLCAAAALIL